MKIAIIGTGGIGGYFGAKIANAIKDSNDEIFFLARGEHLNKIQSSGLKLITDNNPEIISFPDIASDSLSDFPKIDLALLCTKSYDLDDTSRKLNSITDDHSIVMPLLNGVDIAERVENHLEKGIVLPSCTYISSHIAEPGIIRQIGNDGVVVTGCPTDQPDFDLSKITTLFDRCNIKYQIQNNPHLAIWKKYLFITAFGLVTAYSGKTMAEVVNEAETTILVTTIMNEIIMLALAKGVVFPKNIIGEHLQTAAKYDSKTSYQRDIEANRDSESDIFAATIIKMGEDLQIATPETKKLFKSIENKNS
ncbi:MAG: 2-dehydropantoate 2-reductase [Gammaproteobacteria bacterium]|nr:MAG: 2-dehydropantoate 2-reductase [Gammaproteobacteria bacterium]